METIDDEVTDRALAFIDKAHKDEEALLRVVELDAHALPDAPQEVGGRQERTGLLQRRHGRARRVRRQDARQARRARDRRRHHHPLLDGQRAALQHLAGCRHHALPQREEHQLGGRLPRAGVRALAGEDSRRARSSTASSRTRTGCRRSSPRPASPTSRSGCSTATTRATSTSRCTSTATTCCPT